MLSDIDLLSCPTTFCFEVRKISSQIVSLGDFGVTITISVALTFSFYLTRNFKMNTDPDASCVRINISEIVCRDLGIR